MARIQYVHMTPALLSSKRERQTTSGLHEARAHAARVAHARKRGQFFVQHLNVKETDHAKSTRVTKSKGPAPPKPKAPEETLSPAGLVIRFARPAKPCKVPSNADEPPQPLPRMISTSALDPFFKTALDLSVQDRHLLQFCMVQITNLMTCP